MELFIVTQYQQNVLSPIGNLVVSASDKGITSVFFQSEINEIGNQHTEQGVQQLTEYFNKHRKVFELTLDLQGTDFQRQAWQALMDIPYGETRSYQQQASSINNAKAVRAIGMANGRNPISIIVPCHRVIGSNGKLTGYAGGIDKKQWLLQHEGVLLI
ncbi:MAG: methylated-DNA--[protein]-cysteine S-methyltransferase [Kangiellaceae bacterium]|jgi:methylated-DNA-[protein]-cysteine S-methyltransferase|nr:methylated-DNA--[protein]-cysteine S-methyltransferase [Kangiellaceae bacterium]